MSLLNCIYVDFLSLRLGEAAVGRALAAAGISWDDANDPSHPLDDTIIHRFVSARPMTSSPTLKLRPCHRIFPGAEQGALGFDFGVYWIIQNGCEKVHAVMAFDLIGFKWKDSTMARGCVSWPKLLDTAMHADATLPWRELC